MLQGKPQKWCKTLISDIRYPTAERAEMFFYQLPRAAYGRKVEFVTCSPHSIQLNTIWGNILSFQKKQVIRLGNTNPGNWTSAVGNQMADEWSNKHGVESHAHFSEFVFFPGYWSLRILATLVALKYPLIYIFYLFFPDCSKQRDWCPKSQSVIADSESLGYYVLDTLKSILLNDL